MTWMMFSRGVACYTRDLCQSDVAMERKQEGVWTEVSGCQYLASLRSLNTTHVGSFFMQSCVLTRAMRRPLGFCQYDMTITVTVACLWNWWILLAVFAVCSLRISEFACAQPWLVGAAWAPAVSYHLNIVSASVLVWNCAEDRFQHKPCWVVSLVVFHGCTRSEHVPSTQGSSLLLTQDAGRWENYGSFGKSMTCWRQYWLR